MRRSPWSPLTTTELDTLTRITQEYAGMHTDLLESVDQTVNAAMGGLDAIQPSLDLTRDIQDQLNTLSLPNISSQLDDTSFLTDINSRVARDLAAIDSCSLGHKTDIGRLWGPSVERMLEETARAQATFSELAQNLRVQLPTFELAGISTAQSTLLDAVHAATTYLDSLGDDAITVDDDGEVCVNNKFIDREEIQAALSEVTTQAQDEPTTEELASLLLNMVRQAQKSPTIAAALWILVHVLLPILLSVLGNVVYDEVKQRQARPRAIQRQVSQAAQQLDADPVILKTLRIVLKHDLPTYYDSKRKSGRFARLRAGEIVSLLHRNRAWAFIEWQTDDGYSRGWVLARYLGRIEPERVVRRLPKQPRDWSCD